MLKFDDLAKQYDDFRVPQYVINVGSPGGSLKKLPVKDYPVLSINVSQSVESASSAEIVFACPYDYEESDFENDIYSKLEPGSAVEIQLGYETPETVFVGILGSINTNFSQSGVTAGVTCFDAKMSLFYNTKWKSFKKESNMREVVEELLEPCEKYVNIKVSSLEFDDANESERIWKQDNIDDYKFIMRLASLTNASFYSSGDTIYFVSSIYESAKAEVELGWGKGLISFSAAVDISGQVGSVEVAFRNDSRDPDYLIYDGSDITLDGKRPGSDMISKKTHEMTEVLARNMKQAELIAKNTYMKSAMNYVTGRGSTIGIPDIKAGDAIKLTGLGDALSDTYFLNKVTHQFDAGGFLTSFNCQKPKANI